MENKLMTTFHVPITKVQQKLTFCQLIEYILPSLNFLSKKRWLKQIPDNLSFHLGIRNLHNHSGIITQN